MGDHVLNILGLIVAIAAITAVVGSKNSAGVIKALGGAFSGAIDSSLGHSQGK